MAPGPWQAASHGPLTEVAPGLWIVDATLDLLPIGRRMTVWRTADGGLAVHSAVACDDATMAAIDARGPVRWIVVPSGHHRLDAPRFKARYPDAQVVAMPASQARGAQRVAVDGDYGRLPAGGAVGDHRRRRRGAGRRGRSPAPRVTASAGSGPTRNLAPGPASKPGWRSRSSASRSSAIGRCAAARPTSSTG